MPKLVILSGKHTGKRLTLPEKTLIVGRDETCSVRLVTTDISREHCRLRVTSDTIFVTDLGSRNGTFINDAAVTEESPLVPGDFLKVGPMLFQFEAKPEQEDAPAESESESAEEENAFALLKDDEPEAGDEAGHTTVVTGSAAREMARQALIPPPSKENFSSISEEAAVIFRRHEEWQRLLKEQGLD